jgi:hypothetical protein
LGSSEEAQEAEQKTRRKRKHRKQIGSTANLRSTPAPRKKNCTTQSPIKEVRRVGADPQQENEEEARWSRTRAHRTAPRNPSWCLTGARGKKRGGDDDCLYRPWISRRRRAGETFPSPALARQGHLPSAQIAQKTPAQRHAESSPPATVENGVREEPSGGGSFASRGPSRGRGNGGQTRRWAPGSVAEPTGHPFKHALVCCVGGGCAGSAEFSCHRVSMYCVHWCYGNKDFPWLVKIVFKCNSATWQQAAARIIKKHNRGTRQAGDCHISAGFFLWRHIVSNQYKQI